MIVPHRIALRRIVRAGLMGLAACASAGQLFAAGAEPQAVLTGAAADWPVHGGDRDETGYSRLDAINAASVGRLGLAWSLDLPGETTLEATPLAIHGVLYFTGSYAAVYAVDATNGKLLWKYDPQTWKVKPGTWHLDFAVNRGVAYANGRLFGASHDGRLYALDARTGRLLWNVQTFPLEAAQFITGAPRVFNGKVIIGNGGADYGSRGYLTAYDVATGRQVWRFYVAPGSPDENRGDPAMERAAATWRGEYWKTGTGGGPWDSIVFDAALNRIYLGTGNASPYDSEIRSPGGGDNLYTAAIVALDADTGRYLWHYQTTPRDSWDYDSTQPILLADLDIDGAKRRVLMQAPKNGFFYVIDRVSGQLISAQKITKVTWADHIDLTTGRPVEAPNIRYQQGEAIIWPSPGGAHSWQPMAYSPKTGLVYLPVQQAGIRISKAETHAGDTVLGGVSMSLYKSDPLDGTAALLAWDPVKQQAAWRLQRSAYLNGGVLATAGNLVFQGTADGYLTAHDALTGEQRWGFYVGMGVLAPPITYKVGGIQYVSVLAGYGAGAAGGGSLMHVGWKYQTPRRLLTFALDDHAALDAAPPDDTVHAVDDPSITIDPKAAAAGETLFHPCLLCHGANLESPGGPAPDLRESQLALDPESFWKVVHDGVLASRGMPPFGELTREQVLQLYAYVRAGARKVREDK